MHASPLGQWTVVAFAGVAQCLGTREFSLPKTKGLDAAGFKALVLQHYPGANLAEVLEHCRIAVDQEMLEDGARIPQEATELALIPPVSGGEEQRHYEGERSVLSLDSLAVQPVIDAVSHENAGGIDIFIGKVRRNSRGLEVTHLEYDAYPAMAIKVMDQICKDIEEEIPGSKVAIHHRFGRLEIGEAAVIIAASAPHRAPAFDACRKAIETLKQDVPIWKKEFDTDGGTWIGQGP